MEPEIVSDGPTRRLALEGPATDRPTHADPAETRIEPAADRHRSMGPPARVGAMLPSLRRVGRDGATFPARMQIPVTAADRALEADRWIGEWRRIGPSRSCSGVTSLHRLLTVILGPADPHDRRRPSVDHGRRSESTDAECHLHRSRPVDARSEAESRADQRRRTVGIDAVDASMHSDRHVNTDGTFALRFRPDLSESIFGCARAFDQWHVHGHAVMCGRYASRIPSRSERLR